MKFRCRNGHTWKSERFQVQPWEKSCPDCNAPAESSMSQRGSRSAAQKTASETPAHRAAREDFKRLVCEWPCWAREHRKPHSCRGEKDAHHLIPKSWIQQHYGDLPEDELLAIKFNPIIGAPACRHGFHDGLENRSEIIHFEELDDELVVYCKRTDERYPGRQPLLARLKLESPPLEDMERERVGR